MHPVTSSDKWIKRTFNACVLQSGIVNTVLK